MRLSLLLCCSIWLLGCQPAPAEPPSGSQVLPQPIAQQLYIWQRLWTAEHAEALAQSRADFSQLRVLALQLQPTASGPVWQQAKVDLAMLSSDQRPVWLVVRLDGRLHALSAATLQQKITPLVRQWQQAGVQLQGVELDYDSARSQLSSYRLLLQQLKPLLPPNLQLAITALPDWLQSTEFSALLKAVDLLTLQLHSVSSPSKGLFDQALAKQWVMQLMAFAPKRFSLALPAYHSALVGSTDPLHPAQWQVESEVPLAQHGKRQELWLDPRPVQQLLSWLGEQQLPGLTAVVWFRLPLLSDQRAWPYSVLQAVVTGQPLAAQPLFTIQGQPPQLQLWLQNTGNIPLTFPDQLQLQGTTCLSADALQGYRLTATTMRSARRQEPRTHYQLQLLKAAQLAPGARLMLGWWHCQQLTITQGIADDTGVH